jgi:hypothetical protein
VGGVKGPSPAQSNAERRDGISQPEKSRMAHFAIRLFLVRLPSF